MVEIVKVVQVYEGRIYYKTPVTPHIHLLPHIFSPLLLFLHK